MAKFVFLYTEIAGYFLSCVQKLAEQYNAEIHIFRYPVNREAPFQFPEIKKVFYYEKEHFSGQKLQDKILQIEPDFIYCSGWIDKDYLRTAKRFSGKIPTVLGFDNKWENTLRQNVASLVAPFFISGNFSHCFVPGQKQKKYALKLGFPEHRILSGLYSADFDFFNKQYRLFSEEKMQHFPKVFLYAARYVRHKGIEDLWSAFIELQKEAPSDWELWCVGTGDIPPVDHPKIRHFGFVQPNDFAGIIQKSGVYVLPSRFEPWGVSLHEFAAAGFPLICSDEVGASEIFLEESTNGYIFTAGNRRELKNCLKKMIDSPVQHLIAMSERSAVLAMRITPEKWASTLIAILKNQQK